MFILFLILSILGYLISLIGLIKFINSISDPYWELFDGIPLALLIIGSSSLLSVVILLK